MIRYESRIFLTRNISKMKMNFVCECLLEWERERSCAWVRSVLSHEMCTRECNKFIFSVFLQFLVSLHCGMKNYRINSHNAIVIWIKWRPSLTHFGVFHFLGFFVCTVHCRSHDDNNTNDDCLSRRKQKNLWVVGLTRVDTCPLAYQQNAVSTRKHPKHNRPNSFPFCKLRFLVERSKRDQIDKCFIRATEQKWNEF